jgi:uncharacterized protein (DUF433 family)
MRHSRITIRPDQMAGVPCIRGLPIPVSRVVELVADGVPAQKILVDYPDLELEDIPAALHFAADALRQAQPWNQLVNGQSPSGQPSSRRTHSEQLGELVGSVADLPTDMAANHDHYLHGAPKQ